MFKFFQNLIFFSLFFLWFISCSKDENPSPTENKYNENLTAKISFTTEYAIAGSEISFNFSVLNGSDTIANAGNYQYRLDINNDGSFEQGWTVVDTFSAVIEQHGEVPIKLEAKSPEGQIVSCLANIKLFELVKIASTPNSPPGELAWAKDGTDRIVFVWRPTSLGHQLYTVNYPSGVITQITDNSNACKHYPEWSPDGKKIAATYGNAIFIKDLTTGDFSLFIDSAKSMCINWDPSNTFILYEKDMAIYRYDINSGTKVKIPIYSYSLCIDPTGKLLAYFDFSLKKIIIYNLETNKIEKEIPFLINPYLLDWSGDGKYIAVEYNPSKKDLYILDVNAGKMLTIKANRLYYVDDEFAWSPDGSVLAFPGQETEGSSTNIYGLKIKF